MLVQFSMNEVTELLLIKYLIVQFRIIYRFVDFYFTKVKLNIYCTFSCVITNVLLQDAMLSSGSYAQAI